MSIHDEHGYLVSRMHEINSLYQDIEQALAMLLDPRERIEALERISAANKKIGEITAEWV